MAVGNKAGLFGYHTYTDSSLTNTMRNAGGVSSGWASQTSVSLKDVNGEAAGRISAEKCLRGAGTRKKLDPGKYTVILEPAAVSDLVGYLGGSFGARDAEQGQSFLSKQGGGTHLGEKMFPEYHHPAQRPVQYHAGLHALGTVAAAQRTHSLDR